MKKTIKKTCIALFAMFDLWMVLSVFEIAMRSPLAERAFSAWNLVGLLCQIA